MSLRLGTITQVIPSLLVVVDGSTVGMPVAYYTPAHQPFVGARVVLEQVDREICILALRSPSRYYEEVGLSAQAVANATVVQLASLTAGDITSEFGSAWNRSTGLWTCPVAGIYSITVGIVYAAFVASTSSGLGIQRNQLSSGLGLGYLKYAAALSSLGDAGSFALVAEGQFDKNDTMAVVAIQRSGASQTIAPGAAPHQRRTSISVRLV